MKTTIKKETLLGICVILIIAAGIAVIYNAGKFRERSGLARRIISMAPKAGIPETVDALREAISLYERQIEQHVADAARTGTYWRILAVRLQDKGLHRQALEALERAIAYYPDDPSLLYLTGLSASRAAKSSLDFSSAEEYDSAAAERFYALAENAWRSAIRMDDTYTKPMYSLGVLYIYELGRPEDAIPVLERYLDLTVHDSDGMVLLAHAYALTGQYASALERYDEALPLVKDRTRRAALEETRRQVAEAMNLYHGN